MRRQRTEDEEVKVDQETLFLQGSQSFSGSFWNHVPEKRKVGEMEEIRIKPDHEELFSFFEEKA